MIKRKIKYPIKGLILALSVLLLSGCGSISKSTSESTATDGDYRMGSPAPTEPSTVPGYVADKASNEFPAENKDGLEKVISSYKYNMETEEFEKSQNLLKALLDEHKGYSQYSDIGQKNYSSEQKYHVGTYIFRIPSDMADSFASKLSTIGQVLNENKGSVNVTNQYQDMEARINSLEAQEKRLNELFAKTEKIEDIITLESRINTVIDEKESLQRQIQNIDKDVKETTIELNLTEVLNITPKENIKATFRERLRNAFAGSWNSFNNTLSNLVISVVYILPWLLIIAVFSGVGLFVAKKINKKKNNKK